MLVLTSFAALASCTGHAVAPKPSGPSGVVPFRALSERANPTPCIAAPDFEVALTEDKWIDVFDQETTCDGAPDVRLPDVRFAKEVAVAVWWKAASCDAAGVRTAAVQREGSEVVVTAVTDRAVAGAKCPPASAQLESFIALQRTELYDGSEPIR